MSEPDVKVVLRGSFPGSNSGTRIELGGVDVTPHVQAIRVKAQIGRMAAISLEVIGSLELDADAAEVVVSRRRVRIRHRNRGRRKKR